MATASAGTPGWRSDSCVGMAGAGTGKRRFSCDPEGTASVRVAGDSLFAGKAADLDGGGSERVGEGCLTGFLS